MAPLFEFSGQLTVSWSESSNARIVLEGIAEAVRREGGSGIVLGDDALKFEGVTNYRSLSSLTNITHVTVIAKADARRLSLNYRVSLERWPTFAACGIVLVGVILWLAATYPAGFPSGFGIAILLIWIAYIPVLRFRFRRFIVRSVKLTSDALAKS